MVVQVVHELCFPEPIVDLRIFSIPGFSIAVVLISLQGLALWTINLLHPLFLENVLHYDTGRAGLAVAPRGLGVVVALLTVGQLSRRQFEIRPLVCAGLLVGAYEAYRMSQWTIGVHESEGSCRSFSSVSDLARSFRSLLHSVSDKSAVSEWTSRLACSR